MEKLKISDTLCTGGHSCCTPSNPCGDGEGDCDRDSDCENGYICGTDNCKPSTIPGANFHPTDDCCVRPPSTSTHDVYDGLWGSWGPLMYCGGSMNKGYAVEYSLQIEDNQGGRDDTGLNSMCLKCSTGDTICSKKGFWGRWHSSTKCEGGFDSYKFKFEKNQGNGDDAARNNLQLRCHTPQKWVLAVASEMGWGEWHGPFSCPDGRVICGLKTRVEDSQGGGRDDSALNGVGFECCVKNVFVFKKAV